MTTATFAPTDPATYSVSYATGAPQAAFSVNVSATPANWAIAAGYGFHYAIQTPPGPGQRSMRAQLMKRDLIGGGFSPVTSDVVGLP